jgi:hypothetical protein
MMNSEEGYCKAHEECGVVQKQCEDHDECCGDLSCIADQKNQKRCTLVQTCDCEAGFCVAKDGDCSNGMECCDGNTCAAGPVGDTRVCQALPECWDVAGKSCDDDDMPGCCAGMACVKSGGRKTCMPLPTCAAKDQRCEHVDCCSDGEKELTCESFQTCDGDLGMRCETVQPEKAEKPKCIIEPKSSDCMSESTSHGVCKHGNEQYAVHAQSTVTFDGVVSTVDGGDVGVSPGTSISMVETLAHRSGIFTRGSESTSFATHVRDAWSEAMAKSPDSTTAATEIGGMTFSPGTHKFDSAINIAFGTHVTLDGNGPYVFQAGSTLVTAADTFFILTNGAKAENILWVLGTAATLGARSVLEGSILAKTAITFGAQAELRGCALAQTAITFETAGSVNLHSQPSPVCAAQSLSQSMCGNYAVHARTAVTFSAAGDTIDGGNVGVSPGVAITGKAKVMLQNNAAISADSNAFAFDVVFAHSAAIAHRVNSKYIGMAVELGGQTYTPGTYRAGSSMNLALSTSVTLDGKGDPSSKFLFQAGTTLITGANTEVKLINGARAENVLWALGSAATIGEDSIIQGNIMAGTSITFGEMSEVHGCALALAAVTFPLSASVLLPKEDGGGTFTAQPFGSISIDDWEFISNMYEAGNPEKDLASKAYKKCVGKIMCIKVLAEPGNGIARSPGDSWIKDYDSILAGNKYVDQDGQIDWIMEDDKCIGWENCFEVPAFDGVTRPSIEIHANYGEVEGNEGYSRTTSTGKKMQGYMAMDVCQ